MRHASLFSGIGGFDLAAEWMGWENVFQLEIDPFCTKVLEKNFPNTKRYGDIKKFDPSNYIGRIDILTGGFPCQPFSQAGTRLGTEDNRHLWPEMLRVIRIIKPQWVVAENVPGLLNIDDGMVFEQICVDLENEGYEVQTIIIPACAINAPHRRDRVWVIANSKCERLQRPMQDNSFYGGQRTALAKCVHSSIKKWSELDGLVRGLRASDGLSPKVVRTEIKAYGNAIVPQVAYQIFKSLI